MIYRVRIGKAAARKLHKLPSEITKRIHTVILALQDNPRPPGSNKLADSRYGLFRVRVGDYRVVYAVDDDDNLVSIEDVDKRDRIYRKSF